MRTGGLRRKPDAATAVEQTDDGGNVRSAQNLFMNGPEIFNFTLKVIPTTVSRLLAAWGGTPEDVDLYFFHQANKFMLEKLRAKLNIPPEKFWLDLEMTGNTVSSTIPLAMESAASRASAAARASSASVRVRTARLANGGKWNAFRDGSSAA